MSKPLDVLTTNLEKGRKNLTDICAELENTEARIFELNKHKENQIIERIRIDHHSSRERVVGDRIGKTTN